MDFWRNFEKNSILTRHQEFGLWLASKLSPFGHFFWPVDFDHPQTFPIILAVWSVDFEPPLTLSLFGPSILSIKTVQ